MSGTETQQALSWDGAIAAGQRLREDMKREQERLHEERKRHRAAQALGVLEAFFDVVRLDPRDRAFALSGDSDTVICDVREGVRLRSSFDGLRGVVQAQVRAACGHGWVTLGGAAPSGGGVNEMERALMWLSGVFEHVPPVCPACAGLSASVERQASAPMAVSPREAALVAALRAVIAEARGVDG